MFVSQIRNLQNRTINLSVQICLRPATQSKSRLLLSMTHFLMVSVLLIWTVLELPHDIALRPQSPGFHCANLRERTETRCWFVFVGQREWRQYLDKKSTFSPKYSPNTILANYCPCQHLVSILPRKLPTSCPNLLILSFTSLHRNQHLIFIYNSCQHIHLTNFSSHN